MGVNSNADFRGWATKAGLKCSDGRTIMPDAFKAQDGARVPLVWQHGHDDVENVLGHAILENRPDGVYAYAYFNDTPKAAHAKSLVEHQDINSLSIWANKLVQKGGSVFHGAIRELSLVLSGANPGALIEHVSIRHADDGVEVLEDEAVIYTGLPLIHEDDTSSNQNEKDDSMTLTHAEGDEKTVKDVYESMTDEQKNVLHYMVGEAIAAAEGDEDDDSVAQSDIDESDPQAVYDSMTEAQQTLVHFMVGEALDADDDDDDDDDDSTSNKTGLAHQEGSPVMKHNVFEDGNEKGAEQVLSHDDMKGIIADATRSGSLKDAVENYALAHGITDIDVLFPDAKASSATPEWNKRRTEWADQLLSAVRKSPFARVRTLQADITHAEARAKGYVKGNLKKEEFFGVTKRTTTPTTIYKKQKLDRDDIVDITDFDVVAWLKAEMRVMLDEELARAILLGDGRDVAHDDKINEANIRPIAKDHELFTTTVNVNISDAESTVEEIIDAIVLNRRFYRGTGLPTFYTSETYIAQFMLLKDGMGRRLYKTLDEIATELRVARIVPVEVMEEEEEIVGVLVNPIDYVVGTDRGGEVNMFDDFDIDYNNHKYLIETRVSGALQKLKSAIVLKKVEAATVLVSPEAPAFDAETGVVTIPTQTGVEYQDGSDDSTLVAGAQPALADGESLMVNAVPDTGYAFHTSEDDSWIFTYNA